MISILSLTFYGGVNEIGGNKILIEGDKTRLFLDFGMSFGMAGGFKSLPTKGLTGWLSGK